MQLTRASRCALEARHLPRLLKEGVNVLLLDEPTNDLVNGRRRDLMGVLPSEPAGHDRPGRQDREGKPKEACPPQHWNLIPGAC